MIWAFFGKCTVLMKISYYYFFDFLACFLFLYFAMNCCVMCSGGSAVSSDEL